MKFLLIDKYELLDSFGDFVVVSREEMEHSNIVKNVVNEGNPWDLPTALNKGIQAAGDNVLYIRQTKPTFVGEEYDIYICEDFVYISKKAIDTIGYFDNAFKKKCFYLDFAFRSQLAGLTTYIDPGMIAIEAAGEVNEITEMDLIKFGTKWTIPNTTAPGDFWKHLNSHNYEWQEEMKVNVN